MSQYRKTTLLVSGRLVQVQGDTIRHTTHCVFSRRSLGNLSDESEKFRGGSLLDSELWSQGEGVLHILRKNSLLKEVDFSSWHSRLVGKESSKLLELELP
ncbi:hypothetical protein HPB52_022032 [Rhipicephalus sanguineus]|uniref:Uncharacterized protein n=1 Tax=Rhipicephalus sanguineus TaxID=34632 RepID=A0A9D4SVH8_RHISA|nr:hypothetical protein HPB52_022032 [Rhipicephalus sanguineus]